MSNITAGPWSAVTLIHKTTMALARRRTYADPGGMVGKRTRRRTLALNTRSQFRTLILVSEDVIQLVCFVVEFTDVLELEPQHHRSVRR